VADRLRLTAVQGSLALVRHGESTYVAEGRFQGQADPPLSALGARQAALVGRRLANPDAAPVLPLPPGRPIGIWCSTLSRAAQTARLISEAAHPPPELHPDDRLRELAQGRWEGLLHAQVEAQYGAELAAWRTDPVHNHAPGGEPLEAGARRVRAATREVLRALAAAGGRSAAGDSVLGYAAEATSRPWGMVVAHDGILRILMMQLLGVPLRRYWSFPFGLCAITVVELNGRRARLRAHNLEGHLDGLEASRVGAHAPADRGGAL
jgi:broad specificity phosphatase PhoE